MSETSGNLTAASPIPWYKRNVTFDPKSLFKAFGEAAVDLVDGKRVSAAKKIFTVITAGSLQDDPHGLTWLLVTKSLTSAAARIAKESGNHIKSDPDTINLDHLDQDLAAFFKKLEIEIPLDFLVHPQRMPVIEDMKGLLKKWLLAHEMDSSRVETAVQRLNDYFVLELDIEWREGKADYDPVAKRLTSPFSPSAGMNRSWVSYHALLKEKLHEPLFGVETFDITQVYVPLRAYYVKEEESPKTERDDPVSHEIVRGEQEYQAVKLHQHLNEWIDKGLTTKQNYLKVITGGPGSGKSTFVNTLAAEISEKGDVRVLCIPLHDFNMWGHFKNALGEYVKNRRWFETNPLESDEIQPMLIILDGLDELPLQRNEAMENARQFISNIIIFLSPYRIRQLFILITGRTVVIDAIQNELSENEQVLHLLPYLIKDEKIIENCIPKELLKIDQRDEWWKNYGTATGQPYKRLPKELSEAGEKVDDLTAQPLLNYLVALTLNDGEVDFNKQPNISVIYGDLLRQIYEGIHNHKRINPMIKALPREKFETLMQEIAVAVWHGNSGRSTTFGAITARCEKCQLNNELAVISQDTATGVLRLLAAFYFRQYGGAAQENKTIEFTHKSFYEYLVARRIVQEINVFEGQFTLMKTTPQICFTEKEALKKWCELCGPCEFDGDLYTFLFNIFRLKTKDQVEVWQEMLIRLFNYMLLCGMPMESMDGGLTYKEMTAQSANAEEALLAAISACAWVSGKMVEIDWRSRHGFGLWLRRIQGQKGYNTFVFECFNRQHLSKQFIPVALLWWSKLSNANLQEAKLERACLPWADLQWADLQGANLQGAGLEFAKLQGAKLQNASLQGADLQGADLQGADLQGAKLQDAKLRDAKLQGAKLQGANMQKVILYGTNLEAAQISFDQLCQVRTLCRARLDPKLKKRLEKEHPQLFEDLLEW